jgi:hypothetical protein
MKILSISAAPGWVALYKQDDGSFERWQLGCWALVQDAHIKGDADVVGLVVDRETHLLDRCDRDDNFAGYRHEDDEVSN